MPTCEDYVFSVGMGTGIAPIRAMMEERLVDKKDGKNVVPAAMVFGNRTVKDEYYYREEIEEWESAGILPDLFTAFSRD